jgi:hypothetical protein
MQRVGLGLLLALIGSMALSVAAGKWFFTLYEGTIPDTLRAQTISSGTQLMFISRGMMLGVAVFVWTMIAVLMAPLFRSRSAPRA